MDSLTSFQDVIALWGPAAELGNDVGVTALVVRAWKRRNAIPAEYWLRIVAAAERRGFERVTLALLASLAEQRLSLEAA